MESESMRNAVAVVVALERLGVPYMVVGSFSSNAWGVPRSTHDADFVIESDDAIPAVTQALSPDFVTDGQWGFETVTGNRRMLFKNARTAFKIEVFMLSGDAFNQSRFSRRVRADAGDGVMMWLPTPEDVIVQKLRWKREKDLKDVVDVMSVQWGGLDWAYIEKWCGEHGSLENLAKTKAEAEELQ